MQESVQCWAVVPAAGTGSRMGTAVPKQYLPLGNAMLIEHTLRRLAAAHCITGIVVAVGEADDRWSDVAADVGKPVITVAGGAERCHSVLHALGELMAREQPDEWVLVHDAARPCVRVDDIERLAFAVRGHSVGGLLGIPLSDTVKRVDREGAVIRTVDRQGLWRALTPQMFRLRLLHDALSAATVAGELVTDEASAMELAGYSPLMVEGGADNIKVTRPADLAMADFFLRQQERVPCA